VLTLGGATLAGASGLTSCGSSGPDQTASAFVTAWGHKDYAAMTALVDAPPTDFAATYTTAATDLDITSASHVAGTAVIHGSTAVAPLTSHLDLGGYGRLDLTASLHLRKVSGHWLVAWSPGALAHQLGTGDHFAVTRTWPARAGVLGANGVSLTPTGVQVGLVGQRITDPAQVTSLLVAAGFSPTTASTAVRAATAHPAQLQPVGILALATFQAIKAQPGTTLYTVAGTSFTQGAQSTITPGLAHLVGTVGPITADQLRALGGPYSATAQVGQGGIEAAYERRLAGSPAGVVTVADAQGMTIATLGSKPASPGQPVATSIDPTVQRAAESAMAGVDPTRQSALVVLRASTGEILGSVSRPTTSAFDVALDGQVPPGSTFKVITTTALLQHGDTPSTTATCPKTLAVNGQVYRNFEGEAIPTLSLTRAFAVSCNTAFIGLAASLPDGLALVQAASLYGLGTTPKPGIAAAGSKVPVPTDANQRAATAIGQAGVIVSPLAMASVAATVASGAYRAPRLVAGAPDDTVAPMPLPAGIADTLHTLMTAVVTGGTAAGAGLPAGTAGKTGTAEFGAGTNPATHAWFIGFRGDLAFAVFVYGGGVGGSVAAPLAANLLHALPAGYDATPTG